MIRNFLRGKLSLLLALGLIGLGAGSLARNSTAAFFTSTTINPGNTFSTQNMTFRQTPNTSAACTAGPGTTNNPNDTCALLVTLTNMVPGDSKFGKIKLQNAGTSTTADAKFNVWLASEATTSTTLDTKKAVGTTGNVNGTGGTGDNGLGLVIFRCWEALPGASGNLTVVSDCGTPASGNAHYLQQVYPYPDASKCYTDETGTTVMTFSSATAKRYDGSTADPTIELPVDTAFSALRISSSDRYEVARIKVTGTGAANTGWCVGGDAIVGTAAALTSTAPVAVGGPSDVSGIQFIGDVTGPAAGNFALDPGNAANLISGTAQARGLISGVADSAGTVDFLSAVVFLPTASGNTQQNKSSTIQFTWKAVQHVGGSQ